MPTRRLETPAGPHSCTLVTRSGETSPGEMARRSQIRCRFGFRLPSHQQNGGREKASVAAPRSPDTITRKGNECQKNCEGLWLIHLLTSDKLSTGNITHMTRGGAGWATACRRLTASEVLTALRQSDCGDDSHQFGEFLISLVLGRSRGCRRAHASEKTRVARDAPDRLNELRGIIGVCRDGESLPGADGDDITFLGRNRHNRLPGGEDAIHLAGDDDTFEAALHGNDVGIGGGKHGWNLARGEKGEEADIGKSGGGGLQALE